jgi:hypothetical protein
MKHHFYRSAVLLVLVQALWIGVDASQSREPRVRFIPPIYAPIEERLLPGDEIVEIPEPDLRVTFHFDTVDEALEFCVGSSVLVQTAEVLGVEPRLGGYTINSLVRFRVRDRFIGRAGFRRAPVDPAEFIVEGGEMKLGSVLVRAKPLPDYQVGSVYLLFIAPGDHNRLRIMTDPLLVENGRIVAKNPYYPLHGQSVKSLVPKIRRIARMV